MPYKKNISKVSAFSLIELSIVLIIIGLLVAGVTGGASLIESAKLNGVMNEMREYETSVYVFRTLKDRFPGDLNNDGYFGVFSEDVIDSSSFPSPYDKESDTYKIPDQFSAPFVDMYIEKVIDYEPKKYNDSKKMDMKIYSNIMKDKQLYFQYEKSGTNQASYNYNLVNKMTLGYISLLAEEAEKIDKKYDDSIYNDGIIRGYCYGNISYAKANNCMIFKVLF